MGRPGRSGVSRPARRVPGPHPAPRTPHPAPRTPHVDWGDAVATAAADARADDLVATVVGVHDLVRERLAYETGSTHIGIDVDRVLAEGHGVCQDFAHLAVAMCRSVGVPARYVSGYLFTSSDRTGEDVEGDLVNVQTHA